MTDTQRGEHRVRTRRALFYAALVAGLGVGVIVDAFIGLNGAGSTLNDLSQVILVLVCSTGWAIADAELKGTRLGRPAGVLIAVFAPLGIAVYLFRTRPFMQALLTWIAFVGGAVLSILAFGQIGAWLAAGSSAKI